MTFGKRLFDGALLALILPMALVLIAVTALLYWLMQGRPVLFSQIRAGQDGRPFRLWKFRTMNFVAIDEGVCGGDKHGRITRLGRFLRTSHLDELPQLWNVLCGEMSFVGPRPPLLIYVRDYPSVYTSVLKLRPGITGLASCRLSTWERKVLVQCTTPAQTDAAYRRRCISRKARLDRIYFRQRSLALDLLILWWTVTGPPRTGARAGF